MTEEEILSSKPFIDPTVDTRAGDMVDALMSCLMALPTVKKVLDDLPEHTKATLDNFLCVTAAKALEGKPLIENPVRVNILGQPIEEGPVFQVEPGGSLPGGSLLLSGQVKP